MSPTTIAVSFVILIVLLFVSLHFRAKKSLKGVIIRWNVLYLMTVAYITVIGLFVAIIHQKTGLEADDAWSILEGPLMAIIGGTLAISKDLIEDKDNGGNEVVDTPPTETPSPGNTHSLENNVT